MINRTLTLTPDQARIVRLRAQRLTPQQTGSTVTVAQVLKDVCGFQAQDALAASLAVRSRSVGLVATAVEQAKMEERSVVRTWCMRGTLHLLATEDLEWMLPLFDPVFVVTDRKRREKLGLNEESSDKGIRIIQDAIANHGPLTRAELTAHLVRGGVRARGQVTYHLVRLAALKGVICCGPNRNGEETYVLLKDWVGQMRPMSREVAIPEVAIRYINAYGLAGPEDLGNWSGLPMSEVREGWKCISNQLIEVEVDGQSAWMLKERLDWLGYPSMHSPFVRLLPAFDNYLLGYRNRDFAVAPVHARRIHPGGGLLRPAVMVDGRIAGTWRTSRYKGGLEVNVEPFEALAPQVLPRLDVEIADLRRFLQR